MPVSESQRRANAKHDKEHYEYCTVKVKKGQKDRIKAHAFSQNESTNGFIVRAIDSQIERDNAATTAKED